MKLLHNEKVQLSQFCREFRAMKIIYSYKKHQINFNFRRLFIIVKSSSIEMQPKF